MDWLLHVFEHKGGRKRLKVCNQKKLMTSSAVKLTCKWFNIDNKSSVKSNYLNRLFSLLKDCAMEEVGNRNTICQ